MVRLKFARWLVVALVFALSVAVNAQGIRPAQTASVTVSGANVLPPPTDPTLPPMLQDRGIIWGD